MFISASDPRAAPAAKAAGSEAASAYAGRERRRDVAAAFDPVYVGRFVWRWRWLTLPTTLLGLLAGIAFALSSPKIYASGAQILLDPRDIKVVQNEVAPNALPSDATLALVESQTALAFSSRVLSDVVGKAGLEDDPEFNGSRPSLAARFLPSLFAPAPTTAEERRAMLEAKLRRVVTVAREPKSFIINLVVDTESREKSARLANVFADAFIAEIGRIQSDTARRATVALSSRLSELRRSVVEAEGRVEDYKNRNALIGVNGRLVDDEYITRLNDGLARARADMIAIRVRAQSLRSASVDDVVNGTLPEELSSEALMRLRQGASELTQQAASVAATLGPRHPQRIAVEDALRAARQSIRAELARIVSAGQTELARAEETERDFTNRVADLKSKQVETSGAFVKLRELEREVDASRAVYEAFLLRARETSEQESLNTANIRVISEATAPLQPVGPPRKLLAVGGAVAGFALGIGLLVGIAMLRLVVGFLRQDRRGAKTAASTRGIWTEAERAAHRRRTGELPVAEPVPEEVSRDLGKASAEQRMAPSGSPEDVAEPDSRSALRERIRSIAASAERDAASRRPEADALQRELRLVRDALSGIRLGRTGG